MQSRQWRTWVGALFLLAGCSTRDVGSDSVHTQGLYAEMLAQASGDGTTLVQVQLAVAAAGGTKVDLVGDDSLIAQAGTTSYVLVQSARGTYADHIDGDSAGEIIVRLERGSGEDSGSATAALPPAFTPQIENTETRGIDRGTPLDVTWAPALADSESDAVAPITWSIDGPCIWPDSGSTPDVGEMALDPTHVVVRPQRAGEDCEVQLSLERQNQGEVDPVFVPSSNFRAVQTRSISFTSTAAAGEH
jgi:hypothetical protein